MPAKECEAERGASGDACLDSLRQTNAPEKTAAGLEPLRSFLLEEDC